MLIGLTGIIGSGKSTATKFLKNFTPHIIDADFLAREVLKDDTTIQKIRSILPKSAFTPNNELNRKKVADLIFFNKEKKLEFEKLIHPAIDQLYKRQKEEIQAKFGKEATIIYDAPLLFEVGYSKKDFDEIILISAQEEECLKRIILRDKCNKTTALAKLKAQIPLKTKEELATIIIRNDSSIEQLQNNLKIVWQQIKAKYKVL